MTAPASDLDRRARQWVVGGSVALVVLLVAGVSIAAFSWATSSDDAATPAATSRPASTVPASATTAPTTAAPRSTGPAVRVSGDHFVDGNGVRVQLRGVNRAGTEYRCVQDIPYGFITDDNSTDGTDPAYAGAVAAALRTWDAPGSAVHAIDTVRIPLNEDCWLGLGGAPGYTGEPYRRFIRAEVDALVAVGIRPILDLHWTDPTTATALQQDVAPNAEHSLQMWIDVAKTFKDEPSVLFDLFNEPRLWCYSAACKKDYATASAYAWGCYRDGCLYTRTPDDNVEQRTSGQFRVVGTQQLVTAIRRAGAGNVILIEGLGYGNAMDNWVRYKPNDPKGQLAAEIHMYESSGANVNNTANLDATLAGQGLSDDYPLLVGEFGESICDAPSTGFAARTMDWADRHGYGYTAWAWDKGEGCSGPSLVTTNAGAVSPYGAIVQAHLRRRAAQQ